VSGSFLTLKEKKKRNNPWMSLSKKGKTYGSSVALGEVVSAYAKSPSPSASRPKRHAPQSSNGDVVLEISGNYDGEYQHRRRKGRSRRHEGNCGGWLPWINTSFVLVLALFVLLMFLNWEGAGSEITLSRLEGDAPPERYLIPKPAGVMDELRHAMHNHSRRIQFSMQAIPGQFTRYPDDGEYIEGLNPYTLVEHRLCCHINGHVFICDYGQGASHNMALECIVEYTKKGRAYLKIYIQSQEMSGAKCSFNWIASEPKEILNAEATKED
jgi:hypothetical protein